jgi:hypothetical protein
VSWLSRFLRSAAGAPQTARKRKPATPVGMTESEKRRAARHGRRALQRQEEERRTDREEHRLKPVLHGGSGLDDVVSDGVQDQFGEGVEVEFEHDVGAVGFGGVDADVKEIGDFLVAFAFG